MEKNGSFRCYFTAESVFDIHVQKILPHKSVECVRVCERGFLPLYKKSARLNCARHSGQLLIQFGGQRGGRPRENGGWEGKEGLLMRGNIRNEVLALAALELEFGLERKRTLFFFFFSFLQIEMTWRLRSTE